MRDGGTIKADGELYVHTNNDTTYLLITSPLVMGHQSRNDLADLRHEKHPQYDDDRDVNMDLVAPDDNDDNDTAWEDVVNPEEESLVYVIHDILGAR